VRQPKLSNLQFNKKDPILLFGNVHGGVTLVKHSPNLTIGGKVPAGFEDTLEEFEIQKMETLLTISLKKADEI
jgi:dynein intermediate chain 1